MADFALSAGNAPGVVGGVGSILSFIGNMGAGSAARRAGEAQKTEADYEATQLEQNAGQATAAAQRQAMEERRRAALQVSRGVAVAAAGGGATSDPTVQKLLADISGEGAYRASVDLYQGEEKARQLRMGAAAKRYEGDVALRGGEDKQTAYTYGGLGALATGAAGLYGKYGMGGPKKRSTTGSSNSWLDAGTAAGDFG